MNAQVMNKGLQCECGTIVTPTWATLERVRLPRHAPIWSEYDTPDGWCVKSDKMVEPQIRCVCRRLVRVCRTRKSAIGYMKVHMPLRPGFGQRNGFCLARAHKIIWPSETVSQMVRKGAKR